MVQDYNNTQKTVFLIQNPKIQHYNQCLLHSITLALHKQKINIMLHNITQDYILSKIKLNHLVIYYLTIKLKKRYLKHTISCIIKPLYRLVEAKNHWFTIYWTFTKRN